VILEKVVQEKTRADRTYKESLLRSQLAWRELALSIYNLKRPVCIIFEGWDAAGKGGAIKRLTEKLDPRGFTVVPVKAPEGAEKTHHYLWRFWGKIPKQGKIAIFDRSWYGRVLVERVEGFCAEDAWKRAYREIREFERQMADFGTILCKFFIHITEEEQLRRFKEREASPIKQWKITDEDWRNRARWSDYVAAAEEMLEKTSTPYAPWTVVAGNDKAHTRIEVLRSVVRTVRAAVKPAARGRD
jgi:AMP-polyphosphate phosphotransferase